MQRFAIASAPLDVAGLVSLVSGHDGRAGGIATFVGIVRGDNLGRKVLRLEYEAYAPLAVKSFERVADEAAAEWPSVVMAIHHRVGSLEIGEASIAIAAASPHRAEAFGACRYAIERVKQISPIWKREHFEGGDVWLEGAVADPEDEDTRAEARRRACV
jgi:molybdopterin synthase catalytic subunit